MMLPVKLNRFTLVLLLFCFCCGFGYAQQPEQDCTGAIPVCQDSYNQPNSYVGEGGDPDEINADPSCLNSGEKNGVWYVMNIGSDGVISFVIDPVDNFDDYDWAVYNLTNANCADIANNPALEVSCNFSGTWGNTGANGGSNQTSQGAGGTPFNATIPVQAGETYYLYISNYSSSQSGYSLNFGGSTATITDMIGPTLKQIKGQVACNANKVLLEFSENVLCNTVQPGDFTIIGPGGTVHAVTVANSPNCNANNPESFDDEYTLTFNPPASVAGTYTLQLVGIVTDLCNNNSTPGSLSFTVGGGEVTIYNNDTTVCPNAEFVINAAFEGAEQPVYQWTPTTGLTFPNGVLKPVCKPTQTTTYTLTATAGDCPIAPAIFTVTVIPTPPVTISGDLDICVGESTTLTASAAQPALYTWNPGNQAGANLTVAPTQTTTYNVTPKFDICTGLPVEVTINVTPLPSAEFDVQPLVCQGKMAAIAYTGEIVNGTLFNWNFSDGVIVSGANAGPYQVYWPTVGDKTITLKTTIGNCQSTSSKNIEVKPTPIVNAGTDIRICSKDAAMQLDANVSNTGGTGCNFAWLPAEGLDNATLMNPMAHPDVTTTYTLIAQCGGCFSDPDEVTVTVHQNPTLTIINPVLQACAGTGGVQIQTNITGGVGAIGYIWTPTIGLDSVYAASPKANPTDNTIYKVVATDSMGCSSDTAIAFVNIHSNPIADAGPNIFLCDGQPGAFLQGTVYGDDPTLFSYQWSPAVGLSDPNIPNPFATPSSTTIYKLTVTHNITGCNSIPTAIDELHTVTVYVAPLPIVNAGPDQMICAGESVEIGDYSWNAGPNQTFYWSPATGLDNPYIRRPKASPGFTTTYFMKVVSHFSDTESCESIADSVIVHVKPSPNVAAIQPIAEICVGDSVKISAIVQGGEAPLLYQWQPSQGLADAKALETLASPKTTTTYTLHAWANGCKSQTGDTVLVQVRALPVIQADSTRGPSGILRCSNDTIKIPAKIISGDAPFTITWAPTEGLSNPNVLNPLAYPKESTRYYLTVKSGLCVTVDSLDIRVVPDLNAKISGDVNLICKFDSVYLKGSGGLGSASFSWEPAQSVHSPKKAETWVKPELTTIYTLTVKEAGCTDTAQYRVRVLPTPVLDFVHSFNNGCEQLNVSFKQLAVDGEGFVWDFGDGSPVSNQPDPTHTYALPGTYTVTLKAQGLMGCPGKNEYKRTIIIGESAKAYFNSSPTEKDTLVFPDTRVQFRDSSQKAIAWSWSFGDGRASTEQNPTHHYEAPGTYTAELTVTDENGCVDAYERTYIVLQPSLMIPNVFTPNGDGSNDYWRIPYTGIENFKVVVFDRWGNQVFESRDKNFKWEGIDLPTGTYYYLLEIGKKVIDGSVTLLR